MFSDRHYPSSFLAGNKSLRDMFKDPEEYDRRMTSLSKRNEDTQKSLESRNSRIKELSERKSEIRFGQDSIGISRSRGSSLSRPTRDSSLSRAARESSISREYTRGSVLTRNPEAYGSRRYRLGNLEWTKSLFLSII